MSNLPTVGVVGAGFVGSAIVRGFNLFADVKVYDLDTKRATHTLPKTIDSEFVFVCLPTPMVSAEGGECNLSIIENFFATVEGLYLADPGSWDHDPVFILKSTVPVGTTERLRKQYGTQDCP
jgi:UDP-glucose 6-dehydrogenase